MLSSLIHTQHARTHARTHAHTQRMSALSQSLQKLGVSNVFCSKSGSIEKQAGSNIVLKGSSQEHKSTQYKQSASRDTKNAFSLYKSCTKYFLV